MQWKPRDVIALVLLVGCLVLRGFGINTVTEFILLAIAGGYLGLSAIEYKASKKPPEAH